MIAYTYLQLYSLMLFTLGGGALFGALLMWEHLDNLQKKAGKRYER